MRGLRLLGGVALLFLTAPAATAGAQTTELHAGPLAVQGYRMTIDAMRFEGELSMDVTFRRTAGGARQEHVYHFDRGLSLQARRDLRRGRLRADLGAMGRVDLRFGEGARAAPGRVYEIFFRFGPRARQRRGTVRGTFELVADTGFFGTVRSGKLRGWVKRTAADVHCTGALPGFGPTSDALSAESSTAGVRMLLRAERIGDGRVREQFSVITEQPKVTHTIVATAPAESFTTSGDRSAATLTGVAPMLSGTLRFTAKRQHKYPPYASGTVEGDLVAAFDSTGPQRGRPTAPGRRSTAADA